MLQRDYDRLQQRELNKNIYKKLEEERLENIERARMANPFYLTGQRHGVQLTSSIVTTENNNVYLNMIINHQPLTSFIYPLVPPVLQLIGEAPQAAAFNTTKTTPILNKSSDYFCSVIRFTIPLDEVPLQVMPIIPNQSNPNLTPLFVGISYLGINYYSQLIYVPPNGDAVPVQNQVTQVITPYYYTYTYEILLQMINTGLAAAYAASPIPAIVGGTALAPYIAFDPPTGLFSLIVQPYFTTLTAGFAALPLIYVNALLQTYLNSFNYNFIGYDQAQGNDFNFILTNPLPPQIYYPPSFGLSAGANTVLFYKFTQDYQSLNYWTSVRKIVITSSDIPIASESVPASDNTDTNVSYPIISDYVPAVDVGGQDARSIAYYTPTAQYRLSDMLSDNPLQKVDLRFFWQDRLGNFYPLEISPNQQIEVKIAFIKKDMYKVLPK